MTSNQALPRRLPGLSLLAALCCTFVGCGTKPVDVTFELTGNDQMQFSEKRFETTAPARVTIKFKNVGKQLKVVMGHNFVLLKPGVTALKFGAKCVSSGASMDNEYLPEAVMGDVVAHTRLLGPNEEDTVVAELTESGTYEYVCSFPGHAGIMRGAIVVK